MAKDIIDTLHPEGSLEDNFYPNVKKDNIPDGAIDASKIANGSVLNSKIGDEAVTQDKLANELYNSLVTTSDEQTITGQKTFTAHIKNDEIDNTNGNAMLRYKSTENKVVVGGSTIPTTIMGSGDRPTYSKDGSDFNGSPLALLTDVDNKQDKLTAGDNIKIEDNVISATSSGGDGGTKLYKHKIDVSSVDYYIYIVNPDSTNYGDKRFDTIVSSPNIISIMIERYNNDNIKCYNNCMIGYNSYSTNIYYYFNASLNIINIADKTYISSDTVTEL